MKIINCFHSSNNIINPSDFRIRLILAEAFRLIGQSYNQIKLTDQSLENYKQAYDILLPLKDQNCLYRALFDIGHCFISANKYSEAIEVFYDMLNKSTTDNERALVHQYLSFCYLNLNNYDQAKKYAYECLDYASISNEELIRIEANILLGKIYIELKDFQQAEEYIIYAQNLKDQYGDINQMKYLDELILNIKNEKDKIFKENLSSYVQFEEKFLNKLNDKWISSTMELTEHKEIYFENQFIEQYKNKNISNWRILKPYYRLFDICIERKKKNRRNIDSIKQPITTVTNSSLSLPVLSTINTVLENV